MKVICLVVAGLCLLWQAAAAQTQTPAADASPEPQCVLPRKFVEFAYTSFAEAQPNLDNLAIEMQSQPELIAYIYVYAGKRACADEAQTQGKLLQRYLVESYGLAAERVVWKDGGHREQAAVELWAWPRKAGEPTATPDPAIKEVEVIEGCEAKEPKGAGSLKVLAGHNKGMNRTRLQQAFCSRTSMRAGYARR